MSFVQLNYLPFIILAFVTFAFINIYNLRGFSRWVETYWFYLLKPKTRISQYLYVVAFGLLLVSLLDLRGPEKNINAKKISKNSQTT